jgi:RimJ/RimL family protein N-acetyltransferase
MTVPKTFTDLSSLTRIAAVLPDTPETVISIHALRRGFCRACVVGMPGRYDALVIDADLAPGEPACFGDDAAALWEILRDLPGWFAADMREGVALKVAALMARDWGERPTIYGDPHFALRRPAPELSDPVVRRLTPDDEAILEAAPDEVRGAGFGSTRAMLEDGVVAAAVVDGAVVSIAHTSSISDLHADIGVATLPAFRGRGYATVAASIVARAIQARGLTPVWSCGEDNQPSLRIAARLGFTPDIRRVYLIAESRRP